MATVVADMLMRSGDLKKALVEFGRRPRFAKALRGARSGAGDEEGPINRFDSFILQHRLADGRTVVDHFVAAHPDLPEPDRQMLLGWRDVVEGLFEVQRRHGDALLLANLLDELTYRVHSNVGTAVFAQMPRRSFLLARLVPIGQEWLFSGTQRMLPSSARREVARVAAESCLQHPALVFRNPEKLRRAWELQRQDRAYFIEFFGADLIILLGTEAAERIRAYWEHRARRITDGGQAYAPEPHLPPALTESRSVGVIYDEVEGLNFYANFALVAEAFADPEIVTRRPHRHRRAVASYLKDDSVSPLPFQRLAAQDPAKASRLFQLVLKRPAFSWDADGETLLRRRKRAFFDRPTLPSLTPTSAIAMEHYHSATSPPARSRRPLTALAGDAHARHVP
ncbi:MAG: hypothetical protein ACRD0K_09240 [Egibacteraceae bacterium]